MKTSCLPRFLSLALCSVTLLCGHCMPAQAAGREQIGTDGQGNAVFLETGNMTRKGYVVYAWRLLNRVAADDNGALSVRSQVEFDCRNRLTRVMWTTLHSAIDEGGTVISTGAVTSPAWEAVPAGSLTEAQLEFACRHVMR